MSMTRRSRPLTVIRSRALAIAALASLAPTLATAQDNNEATDVDRSYELILVMGQVLEHVRENYVTKTSEEDLIRAAIQGMVASLDPHSAYFDHSQYRDFTIKTKGRFGGLGIDVVLDESGAIRIVSPLDDTPASRAGLLSNDLITAVDGTELVGLTLEQAVDLLRGEAGAPVVLTIARGDQPPFQETIVRDTIRLQAVRSWREGDLGYVRIASFNDQASSGLQRALEELNRQQPSISGLILDLRTNPGGLLSQALSITDAFLDRGEIVSVRSGRDDRTYSNRRYQATEGQLVRDLPIAVLIDQGSASASEIVAGALQDHRRATLIGTRSFGKGSVQNIFDVGFNLGLPRSTYGLKLTTQHYYTPSGELIDAKGIYPDIIVEPQANIADVEETYYSETRPDDVVLAIAIRYLRSSGNGPVAQNN